MNFGEKIYLFSWAALTVVNALIFLKRYRISTLLRNEYWNFICQPWKVITFLLALVGICGISPYTDDPTWDYFSAGLMSILTFSTAPWVVGILFKFLRGAKTYWLVIMAVNLWMLSAAWSYDLYLLLRDSVYPPTWLANIPASSCMYLAAGLFWNLDWEKETGVYFSFFKKTWPTPNSENSFKKIFWVGLLFILLIVGLLSPFVWRS